MIASEVGVGLDSTCVWTYPTVVCGRNVGSVSGMALPGCGFNCRVRELERNAPFGESVRNWCVSLALHTPYKNY